MKHAILATALAAFSTLTADAALITWGTAQNITGDSDVSTNGTLVNAFNLGETPGSTTTVNGVTFAAFGVPASGASTATVGDYTLSTAATLAGSNGFGSGAAPFSSLSGSYQLLLRDIAGVDALGPAMTLTIAGLNVGASYEFQWWASDSIGANNRTVTATAGNAVTLATNVGAAGGLGQFAIGTFVADSASQAISFSGNVFAFVNGFQLRNLAPAPKPETPAAVPEPGTALAGVMLAGLLGLRRRREAGVIGEK